MTEQTRIARRAADRRSVLKAGVAIGGLAASGALPSPAIAQSKTINVLTLGQGIFGDPFVKLSPEFTAAPASRSTTSPWATTSRCRSRRRSSPRRALNSTSSASTTCSSRATPRPAISPRSTRSSRRNSPTTIPTCPSNLKDVWSLDGQTYGMATVGNCQNFIYNNGHLADAGLQPPDTWNDVLTSAQKVVERGQEPLRLRRRHGAPDQGGDRLAADVLGEWRRDLRRQDEADLRQRTGVEVARIPARTDEDHAARRRRLHRERRDQGDGRRPRRPRPGVVDPRCIIDADHGDKAAPRPRSHRWARPRRSPSSAGIGLCVSNYAPSKGRPRNTSPGSTRKDVQSKTRSSRAGGQPCRNSAWAANADAHPWFPSLAENLKVAKSLPQIPEWGQVDAAISTQLTQAFAGEIEPKAALEAAQAGVERSDAGRRLL